jgi:hypothetical protein
VRNVDRAWADGTVSGSAKPVEPPEAKTPSATGNADNVAPAEKASEPPSSAATDAKVLGAGIPTGPKETDVLCMIMLMGALGGLLHLASSLGRYVGNRRLLKSWIIYYLLMPFEGAAMACVVYLLLRVGVLMPATSNSPQATASLNLIGLYAFAALTGIFTEQALEALAEVFSTIFKKVHGKDPLDDQKKATDAEDATG